MKEHPLFALSCIKSFRHKLNKIKKKKNLFSGLDFFFPTLTFSNRKKKNYL